MRKCYNYRRAAARSTHLNKILIANRGEIAVRIIRTCREMGLATVAVYSECDRNALHVRLADEAHAIGPDQASESYLRIDKLIDVCRASGVDGVHPGYGFLAENADFAEACSTAGLTFIGPSAAAMRAMGSKTTARDIAAAAGVPVVPGGHTAEDVGYPLLVKAVAGGGGKGMRVVRAPAGLDSAVALAKSEARSSFNDDRVYFERLLERPRHIEVQLLGDLHGTIVPFVERECSIQRRHQKLIEETPSPSVTPALRERLMAAAAAIGRKSGYTSAGTIEFLVDATGEFFFLEMNTRLQVEHPITEAVTGIDFVRAQIEIARGARLADLKVGTTTGTDTSYVVPTFRSATTGMDSSYVVPITSRLRLASARQAGRPWRMAMPSKSASTPKTPTRDFFLRPGGLRTCVRRRGRGFGTTAASMRAGRCRRPTTRWYRKSSRGRQTAQELSHGWIAH